MYIPKRYGESKIERCPFCSQQAVSVNGQGIPVCTKHKEAVLNEMRCVCGGPADLMTGKFGVYFNCMSCGNINAMKIFEMNKVEDVSAKEKEYNKTPINNLNQRKKYVPNEITIRSDDPRYF